MVKNYIEQLVTVSIKKELVEHWDAYSHICLCQDCLLSVKASALNHLEPFYVTCMAGEVFGEYRSKEIQNLSDVTVAVVKSLEEILAVPLHPAQ